MVGSQGLRTPLEQPHSQMLLCIPRQALPFEGLFTGAFGWDPFFTLTQYLPVSHPSLFSSYWHVPKEVKDFCSGIPPSVLCPTDCLLLPFCREKRSVESNPLLFASCLHFCCGWTKPIFTVSLVHCPHWPPGHLEDQQLYVHFSGFF